VWRSAPGARRIPKGRATVADASAHPRAPCPRAQHGLTAPRTRREERAQSKQKKTFTLNLPSLLFPFISAHWLTRTQNTPKTWEKTASQIFYPCMQCADIFFLKADICQLGMDQRKARAMRKFAHLRKCVHECALRAYRCCAAARTHAHTPRVPAARARGRGGAAARGDTRCARARKRIAPHPKPYPFLFLTPPPSRAGEHACARVLRQHQAQVQADYPQSRHADGAEAGARKDV
jgi:hypothetical protein